jgi:hypothetical protein
LFVLFVSLPYCPPTLLFVCLPIGLSVCIYECLSSSLPLCLFLCLLARVSFPSFVCGTKWFFPSPSFFKHLQVLRNVLNRCMFLSDLKKPQSTKEGLKYWYRRSTLRNTLGRCCHKQKITKYLEDSTLFASLALLRIIRRRVMNLSRRIGTTLCSVEEGNGPEQEKQSD